MKFYKVARAIARPFVKVVLRYKVEGKDNIPDCPFFLVANHVALRDPVCLGCAFSTPIRFIAKAEFEKNGLIRWFMKKLGIIFVNRNKADLGAIRAGVDAIKNGNNVGIFPQGTRTTVKAEPQQALGGITLMCAMAKAPVLPVALVYGTYKPKLFFTKCRIVIGKPISYEEYSAIKDRKEQSEYVFGKVCELIDNGGN